MIIRKLKSKALRAALACGASAVVMALAPMAHAQSDARQESAVYLLRYAQEIADGTQVISQSKDMMMARRRIGDRSMMVVDTQNGALIVERLGGPAVYPLISRKGPEASYAFDYGKLTARGTGFASVGFNGFVKPLVGSSPPLGQDARWSVEANLKSLGLPDAPDAKVKINLSRIYLEIDGKAAVLIEFDIPAFSYAASSGDSLVHWARGMAVTDPGFGEIHALATQHRASVREADGDMRPVSIRTTMHGVDRTGGWRMSFAGAPRVKAAMDRVIEVQGDSIHLVSTAEAAKKADDLSVLVASRLNTLAFGLAENSPNGIGMASSAGDDPATLQSMLLPGGNPYVVNATQADVDRYNELMARQAAIFGQPAPAPMTVSEYNQMVINIKNALDADFGTVASPDAAKQAQLAEIDAQLKQTYAMLAKMVAQLGQTTPDVVTTAGVNGQSIPLPSDMFPTGQAAVDRYNQQMADAAARYGQQTPEPMTLAQYEQMMDTMAAMLAQHKREEDLGAVTQTIDQQQDALFLMLMDMVKDLGQSAQDPGGGELTADQLDALVSQMARQAELQGQIEKRTELFELLDQIMRQYDTGAQNVIQNLHGQLSPEQYDALLAQLALANDPRLQDANLTGFIDIPGWVEPGSQDEAEYRQLIEQLQAEMAKMRELLDGQTNEQKEEELEDASGFGDNADFYENNAFDYTSMVGIIPTDLSRWGEWLATQNVRELERLAKLAGYPNLASALADAQSIIRQAEDPGYRQWAMQAPSCAGYAGCGPNYLERWWMKQSIVALGDILADSRDIFSTGGFSDIGISGLTLSYLLRDHATEDGDIVRVRITQFGKLIYEGQISLTNIGQLFNLGLGRGVASIEILAVNEGSLSPNTAQIKVDDVVRGQATQTYSLQTGETATLRVEAGAKPGATSSGTSGVGQ